MILMKAITLWQPWASAIALGYKKFETRSWATKYRGSIAIHATAKKLTAYEMACCNDGLLEDTYIYKKDGIYYLSRNKESHEIVLSKVVAIAEITNCIPITEQFKRKLSKEELSYGDYSTDGKQRYAWQLENVKQLLNPIEIKGQQGLWNIENINYE